MALKIESTSEISSQYVKILAYGHAGAGKTFACRSLNRPFVLSCEGGLLSLRGTNIPYVNIRSESDMMEAIHRLSNMTEKKFDTIVLDSISELADIILSPQKMISRDARQAYGYMQDSIKNIIRLITSLPFHIYMTAKAEHIQDEDGVLLYSPSMPGNKLAQGMPYLFDEVLAMRIKEESQEDGSKKKIHYVQTDSDGKWHAKDRSGNLNMYEEPNLQNIIDKCLGVKGKEQEQEEEEGGVQPEIQDMEPERRGDDIPG